MSRQTVREYVESLPDCEKDLIVYGFNEFERTGVIGDEPLRLHAVAFMSDNNIPGSVTMWMNLMAMEVFRYYTARYHELRNALNHLKSVL